MLRRETGVMGGLRKDVLESMSEEALKRLSKLTGSIIEELIMLLSGLRKQILRATDTSEIKRMSSQVDALVKCIQRRNSPRLAESYRWDDH
jgi:hypothetical protein